MEIFLVRHTSVNVPKGICYGKSDVGLSERASAEIKNTVERLSNHCDIKTAKVWSSPATRCLQLAESINAQFDIDERLWEMNFGDWEMKAWDDIKRKESETWMMDFVNVRTPNGESFKELSARANEFLDEVIDQSHRQVVLVNHAATIRTLICRALDLDLKNAFRMEIDYGSISKITYKNGFWSVRFINN
ncbi:MAG: alpha-ribazole phosphatase [Arcicella sp.]|jgi:alpha-ribazole phosphatase|nr:alpha-ribazole phosphatase [Arcicella sp.]